MIELRRDPAEWEPNKAINIVPEIDMRLNQAEEISSGRGAIEFRWLPTPGYYFVIQGEDKKIAVGDAILRGKNIGELDVKVRWINNENGNLICEGPLNLTTEGLVIGDKNGEIDFLYFYLPNFGINHIAPLPTKFITYKNWEVHLIQFRNIKSLFDTLDKEGGYAFTYKCIIKHNDGAPFTFDQAVFLIGPLRFFFSFIRGAICSPLFFTGFKTALNGLNGESNIFVFEIHPKTTTPPKWPLSRWTDLIPPLWCDEHSQQHLNDAFNRFMDFYTMGELALSNLPASQLTSSQDPVNIYEHLAAIFDMYLESNMVTFGETAIMLIQSSLESLAHIQAERLMCEKCFEYFSSKAINAETKIKWILDYLSIPTDIPPQAQVLTDYLIGKGLAGPHNGVGAITYFRNGIIHANAKSLHRTFGRLTDPVQSEEAMEKAVILGRMYVELAILHMLNYNGMYTNRFTKSTRQVDIALS